MAAQEEARSPARRLIRRFAVTAALVVVVVGLIAWASWPDVGGLAEHNPSSTAFIDRYRELAKAEGRADRLRWTWVPYERISPEIKRAVISGEDLEFFFHHGFSEREMMAAFREAAAGGRKRGASTLTQQLAKNLWLSSSKNPLRKVKEALLTWQLERKLGKSRILEIYLNVVEFGPGIYGVEAASRAYFNKPAADVDAYEAAQLAASLPRPSDWHPGVSSTYYASYVAEIERRMTRAAFLAKYVGGGAIVVAGAPAVPDSALKALLDSIAAQVKADTIVGDTLMARDTAKADSMRRDSIRRDSLRKDTVRHDTIGH